MQRFSENITRELAKRSKYAIPVVEIYPRSTLDIVSIAAPVNAIGRFSTTCFDWETSVGTYRYEAKVTGFPEVNTYITEELNNAEIEFSNVKRGDGSMARFVLDNHVKGCWMVIRLIFPNYPDESIIMFWGKCDRPGGINNQTVVITATQDMGNHGQQIPFRTYGANCPLEFAKPGGGCLGNQTLAEKSISYRLAVATYGSSGCNKLFSTCTLLENTNYFQGQRVVAVSGQFSYITVEEVVKRVLFWTKRKKISVVKTDNWSSVNQSEGQETVPIGFGRFQVQGHPYVWADVGAQVRGLYGFAEGRVSAFTFLRSRTEGINIVQTTEHLGDWGNVGTQGPDTLFSGVSGVNSRLAYVEILTDGSSPTQVDDAPIITAVIRGLEVPVPDPAGNFTVEEWSNNPVAIVRYLLTDTRFGRIPSTRMDDVAALDTFNDCDEIVEDRTNEEAIVLPSNEAENYGVGYRRFRSTGRYTAYKDMYNNEQLPQPVVDYPEFEEPEIRWFNPFETYTIPVSQTVIRQKYTANGAVQEETSLFDFITTRILPTFKGYLNYGFNGKIQIKNRRKADNAYMRGNLDTLQDRIPITNIAPWRYDPTGFLVIGVSLREAEIRQVAGFEYSPAGNSIPIVVQTVGGVTAIATSFSGGTISKPAIGYIDLAGTPAAGSYIEVTIDTGSAQFIVSYSADGVENLECYTRMLTAFLNANVQFQSYLTAYILPSNLNRIHLRCELGSLIISESTEYEHFIGEEIMRVQAVFENCGELTSNTSAQFDNIIQDSFKWNEQKTDELNAVIAKYTSAVDDFRTTLMLPRAAWDTIDLDGELVKEEIDFRFVDNYWQAAYLAKGEAIDRIDGNIHFNFETSMVALGLELGDVVAVRHDSGDGALNYVPVWITEKSINIESYKIQLSAKLYLTAAFDYHVQPIDALLTTTLNITELPDAPPATLGSSGGVGGGSTPVVDRPDHGYYTQFGGLGQFSPTGVDRT